MSISRTMSILSVSLMLTPLGLAGTTNPAITAFILNDNGAKGRSEDVAIHAVLSHFGANVQQVQYNSSDVYINVTGIPSYPIGPWPDGNPAVATDRNWLFHLSLAPVEQTGTKTATPLGNIGTLVNGVPIYNSKDAHSFRNQGVWNQNAVIEEADGMDSALGHPSPARPFENISNFVAGRYHHHQRPISLLNALGDNPEFHSPLIGFAFDGFPVYGPYGYHNVDGSSEIGRIESSYELFSGFRPLPADGGPGGPYDGTYIEDYAYVAGLGHLDEHNGRFGVTPEYPDGIYHYVTTVDDIGESAYPYIIGPTYYGVVLGDNFNQSVVVPADVEIWDGLDCNGDGQVNAADFACSNLAGTTADLRNELNLIAGDLDGVGGVAFADFLRLAANFGDASATQYNQGDLDGVGGVTFADFLALAANFGMGGIPVAAAVPEPSSLALFGLGGILLELVRRRRSR